MPLNKSKGNMFKSVGWTWTVCRGCSHDCAYCWAAAMARRRGEDFGKPILVEKDLNLKFPKDDSWIFICSSGDLFSPVIPDQWIHFILDKINRDGYGNRFLLQTKNPARILRFTDHLVDTKRYIIGTTIETNRDTSTWSRAPPTQRRVEYLTALDQFDHFLSLEPLADFDLNELLKMIKDIRPFAIEVGLENYTNFLPKPPREKILRLLDALVLQKVPIVLPKPNLKPYLEMSG
jgi:DNA repair photolyase